MYSSGKTSNITPERISALMDLDFVFDPRTSKKQVPSADTVESSSLIDPFVESGTSLFHPTSADCDLKPDSEDGRYFV